MGRFEGQEWMLSKQVAQNYQTINEHIKTTKYENMSNVYREYNIIIKIYSEWYRNSEVNKQHTNVQKMKMFNKK